MDPLEKVCKYRDSFSQPRVSWDPSQLPREYLSKVEDFEEVPKELFLEIPTASLHAVPNLPPVYCDREEYETLQKKKDRFTSPRFLEAERKANPFEGVGHSIFRHRSSLPLATLDAIYKLTGHYTSLWKMRLDQTYEIQETEEGFVVQTEEKFTFCDLDAGPGAFTQYVQFRVASAVGYGMTEKEAHDWDTSIIDTRNFHITYGEDGSGNLWTNGDFFISYVLEQEPDGVSLVLTGAAREETSSRRRQEYEDSPLLLEEIRVGISCLRSGGTFVAKVWDTVTEISAQLLYVFSRCFHRILLFTPMTSRPAQAEQYLVGLGRHETETVESFLSLLKTVRASYRGLPKSPSAVYVLSFLQDPLPESFRTWLIEQNHRHILSQTKYAQDILNLIDGKEISLPYIDGELALKILGLPGNLPKEHAFRFV